MACATIADSMPVAAGLAALEFDSAELKDLDLGKGEHMHIFSELEKEFSDHSEGEEMLTDVDSDGSISPVPPVSPSSVMDSATPVEKPANVFLNLPGEWQVNKRERRHSLDFLTFGGGGIDTDGAMDAAMEKAFHAAEELMEDCSSGSKKGGVKKGKGKKKDMPRPVGSSGVKKNAGGKESVVDKTVGVSEAVLAGSVDVANNALTEVKEGGNVAKIGAYTLAERKERIRRFHEKRRYRVWDKKIKYDCRKKLADSRPRVKGRFVKRDENSPEDSPEDKDVADLFANVSDVDLSMIDDVVAAVTLDAPLESVDLNSPKLAPVNMGAGLVPLVPVAASANTAPVATLPTSGVKGSVNVISSGRVVAMISSRTAVPAPAVVPQATVAAESGKVKRKIKSKRIAPY